MKLGRTVKTLWNRGRKSGTALVASRLFQHRFGKYGHMLNFNIDSLQKKVFAEILLEGEKEPVTLTVDRYEVEHEEGRIFVTVRSFSASRKWISLLAADFLVNRRIEVPSKYAHWIGLVL